MWMNQSHLERWWRTGKESGREVKDSPQLLDEKSKRMVVLTARHRDWQS